MPHLVTSMFWIGLTAFSAGTVGAQDYPNKPIRIVTGSVGGGSDTAARQIAQGISGSLGQSMIIENRPSIVASEVVAKAAPDGYTLLLGGSGVWLTAVWQKTNYDAINDFAPLTAISREINMVAVHPSLPAKSVKELIALAKAKSGELNYSASLGSGRLATELFRSMAGINLQHVPYKGAGPAIAALVGGEVHLTINELGLMAPHVKSGKLRALAVTSATQSALAPGVPTVAASVPGYEWVGITHLMVPAKTPPAIVTRLHQEVVRYLSRPEVKERFLSGGTEIVASSPEELTAIMKSEITKTAKLIKDAGIRME